MISVRFRPAAVAIAVAAIVGSLLSPSMATAAPTGSISGKVTADGSTAGIQNAFVDVRTPKGDWVNSAETNSAGNYTVGGLEPGNYKIQVHASGYVTGFYSGKTTLGAATVVSLAQGQALSGRNIALDRGATISGNVKTDDGANLAGRFVAVMNRYFDPVGYATTNSSGNFTITGIPAGEYTIAYSGDCNLESCLVMTRFDDEWWNNASVESDATFFHLAANATASGYNAVMNTASTSTKASVAGRITGPGGVPVVDVEVAIVNSAGYWAASDYTDSNGYYLTSNIVAGNYTVQVDDNWDAQLSGEWWSNKHSLQSADYFALAAGQAKTGIDLQLEPWRSVSGTVTGNGGPVDEAEISVYSLDGTRVTNSFTDTDGTYTVTGLAPGQYKLRFEPRPVDELAVTFSGNAAKFAAAAIVTVGTADVTGIDGTLPVGATISGRVTNPGGSGVSSASMYARPIGGSEPDAVYASTDDNDGFYTISSLRLGSYVVDYEGYADGTAHEWWNNAYSSAAATPISVTTGATLTGYNVQLDPAASISGVLTNDASEAIDAARVQLWKATDDGYEMAEMARTDGEGGYMIPGLEAGTYTVSFNDYASGVSMDGTAGDKYVEEYWNDKPTLSAAQTFTITTGDNVTRSAVLAAKVVLSALTATPTPTITGQPRVGSTLTVATGTWSPAPVTLAIQWMRAGHAIPGATGTTYAVTESDLGSVITVSVSGTKSGYTPATKTSAATPAVTAAPEGTLVPGTATISGSPAIGQTLSAETGSWAPDPDSFEYQWKRAGVAIAGATGDDYQLVTADLAKTITVTVTGIKAGFDSVSATSAGVKVGVSTAPVPTVTGTATVGSTLTAKAGTWKPSGITLKYQWTRDGVSIPGATKSTYKLAAADAPHAIGVDVTGTRSGYAAVVRSSIPKQVRFAFSSTPAPTITGYIAVGQPLVAEFQAWTPAADDINFTWKVNGVVVSTGDEYTPTSADKGKNIVLTVVGSKTDYVDVTKSSKSYKVGLALTPTGDPTITGEPSVGRKLTANAGSWGPAPVKLSYQWKRNGVSISKATKSTYTPTKSDSGKSITVVVTGAKSGYTTLSRTSASVPVAKALTAVTPKVTGTPSVGSTLSVTPGAWKPSAVEFSYQWLSDGTAIADATNASYVLAESDVDHDVSVRVTGSLPGYTSVSRSSAARSVGYPIEVSTMPSVTGAPTVGQTLTGNPGTFATDDLEVTYQWTRNSVAIANATGLQYSLVSADAGKVVAFTVTATKPSHTTSVQIATATTIGKALTSSPVPTITGTVASGAKLSAKAGTWAPATVTLSYQWLHNGEPVGGATKSSFTVSDPTGSYSVVVTGKKSGYTTVSRESSQVSAAL
jgi:hypothetical protein